jgi:hypothetical protein
MARDIFEYVKKWGIFAVLFCGLFVWTISNYEKREVSFIQHEAEYHKIIADNQKIVSENQKLMGEYQKQLEGFKVIIDVKLEAIQKEIEKIRR